MCVCVKDVCMLEREMCVCESARLCVCVREREMGI